MKSYKETLATVVDFRKKKDKQWLTPEACRKVYGKTKAKDKLLSANTSRLSTISIIKESRGVSEETRDPCCNNFLVKQRRLQLRES